MNMPLASELVTDRMDDCIIDDRMDLCEPACNDAVTQTDDMSRMASRPCSSARIIDNKVHPTVLRARGLAVVEDNFYQSKQTGIHISLFHNDSERVTHLASLHGIQTGD